MPRTVDDILWDTRVRMKHVIDFRLHIVTPATRSSEFAFSRHTLTSTTPPHSQRVFSLPSIARMIKEPQRLEKNRELYSKAVNSKQLNSLNTATNIDPKERRSFLFRRSSLRGESQGETPLRREIRDFVRVFAARFKSTRRLRFLTAPN